MKFFIFACLLAVALANHEVKDLSSSEGYVEGAQNFFKVTQRIALFSCKESVDISEEKHQQYHDVIFQTSQESSSISSTEETADSPTDKIELTKEEQVYLKQLSKINQFYQGLNLPQYLQAYSQYHIVRNPWNQIKINDYLLFPPLGMKYPSPSQVRGFPVKTTWHPEADIEESTSISQETSEKIVDMESTEVTPEEVEMSDEKKNYLKHAQIHQFHQKFTFPQYFQAVHPQQIAMNPWNRLKGITYPFIPTLV